MRQRFRRHILLAGLALVVGAGISVPARAQATGAFARIGFDSRGIALGNAVVADASGHTSPYYNPALAPMLTGQHFGLSAAYLRLDRQLQSIQFGAPLRPRAGIALGLVHAGVSKIDGRDNSGFHTGNLSTDEFAMFMAFGIKLADDVSAGLTLQLFRSDLLPQVDAVNTVGLDAGLLWQAAPAITVGLVVEDLLAKYEWDTSAAFGSGGKTTTDNFPRRFKAGVSYAPPGARIRVNGEAEFGVQSMESRSSTVELLSGIPFEVSDSETVFRTNAQVRIGAEYALSSEFSVLAGIDRMGDDLVDGAVPTAGFRVAQPLGNLQLRAGYAFLLEPAATGAMHMLTLRVFL